MPIYEFYCQQCHMIFNFFSCRINTSARPPCPRCQNILQRKISNFTTIGKAQKEDSENFIPEFDEGQMQRILAGLSQEAENTDTKDPRKLAQLIRKFSDQTGLPLGDGIEEAMNRLEAGEDPDKIEAEMGEILENENPFAVMRKKRGGIFSSEIPPVEDETLYEL